MLAKMDVLAPETTDQYRRSSTNGVGRSHQVAHNVPFQLPVCYLLATRSNLIGKSRGKTNAPLLIQAFAPLLIGVYRHRNQL